MFINTKTLAYNVSEQSVHDAYPNTSLPQGFDSAFDYARILQSQSPVFDPVLQYVIEGMPVLTDGAWMQNWIVYELFETQLERDEAIAADTEAKRKAAVPASVSPRQIRQALTRANLRVGIESAIAAGDQDTKDWYEFATEFQRSNQHVTAMGLALGVTELQLDDLFVQAAAL